MLQLPLCNVVPRGVRSRQLKYKQKICETETALTIQLSSKLLLLLLLLLQQD